MGETEVGRAGHKRLENLPAVPGFWACPLYPFADLPVGLDHAAEILAESILVENALIGIGAAEVPEAAGIRTDLISNQQLTGLIQAQFQLEIHQLQAQVFEKRLQHSIHLTGQRLQALA